MNATQPKYQQAKDKQIVVPRQIYPYSCGPACLVTVGRLIGREFSECDICDQTGAMPTIGTTNAALQSWAEENLPVASCGSNTYRDGLAIWNIRNVLSGVGHYVVVLGRRSTPGFYDKIRYYDPYWARTFELGLDEIEFKSGDGQNVRWSINFEMDADLFNARLIPDADFHRDWAITSLEKWLSKREARIHHEAPSVPEPGIVPRRHCPSGGGACSCTPDMACKHPAIF